MGKPKHDPEVLPDISAQRLMELCFYVDKLKNVCDDDPTNTSQDMGKAMYDIYCALIELSALRKITGRKDVW